MADIIASLEKLDTLGNEDAIMVVDSEEMFELITLNDELTESLSAVHATETEFDEMFAFIDKFQFFVDHIEEHGLAKSTMALMDPTGEMAKRLELPSMEDLDINPVKDANAVATCEAFKDKAGKAKDAIIAFFKKVIEVLKTLATKAVQMFSSYERTLKSLTTAMKDFKLDDEKAKNKKVTVLSKSNLAELGVSSRAELFIGFNEVAIDQKATTEDLTKVFEKLDTAKLASLGLKVNDKKDGFDTEERPVAKEVTVDKIAGDVNDVLKIGKDTAQKLAGMKDYSKTVINASKAAQKQLESALKSGKVEDEKPVKVMQAAVKAYNKLVTATISTANICVKGCITYANAVRSCAAK